MGIATAHTSSGTHQMGKPPSAVARGVTGRARYCSACATRARLCKSAPPMWVCPQTRRSTAHSMNLAGGLPIRRIKWGRQTLQTVVLQACTATNALTGGRCGHLAAGHGAGRARGGARAVVSCGQGSCREGKASGVWAECRCSLPSGGRTLGLGLGAEVGLASGGTESEHGVCDERSRA